MCCPHCSVPTTEKPPSDQARAHGQVRKGGPQKTAAQKAKLLAAAARLPKDSAGRFIGSGTVCAEAGFGSPDYITRRLLPSVDELEDDDVPFERQERSDAGVPVKMTSQHCPRKTSVLRRFATF